MSKYTPTAKCAVSASCSHLNRLGFTGVLFVETPLKRKTFGLVYYGGWGKTRVILSVVEGSQKLKVT